MNILVVGGAGYIGNALAGSLLHAGHKVKVLDLLVPARLHEHCEYVRADLLDTQSLGSALHDVEAVYHLAWGFYPRAFRREVEENLFGTLNLLEACRASRVGHLVFASTAVVYGPTGEKPARETDPCHPERTSIGGPAYGTTKLACEHYMLALKRDSLPATIMRIHGVFSHDRLAQFSGMIDQANEGKDVVAVAEAGGQYAHLDDVVWAMCTVLGRQDALGQVFNIAGSRLYRDREIAEYIVRKAGTASKVVLVSDPGQGMVSVCIEKASQSFGYRPRESDFLREFIDARLS